MGDTVLFFLAGIAVGAILGIGVSSFLQRTIGKLFSFLSSPRERELKRAGREQVLRVRTCEARLRRKDELIRRAIVSVQRENRDRVARMMAGHSDRAVDLILRVFRRPPRPVPEDAIRRCRESYPETARNLERALKD